MVDPSESNHHPTETVEKVRTSTTKNGLSRLESESRTPPSVIVDRSQLTITGQTGQKKKITNIKLNTIYLYYKVNIIPNL